MKTIWLLGDDRQYLSDIARQLDKYEDFECRYVAAELEYLYKQLEGDGEKPDVIIINPHSLHHENLEKIGFIKQRTTETILIVLSDTENDYLIFKVFDKGASACFNRDVDIPSLQKTIEVLVRGGVLLPADLVDKVDLLYLNSENELNYGLTDREKEVLQLLAQGYSHKKIGEILSRSTFTVNNHVQHIYKKLQVNSGIQAVAKAIREDLI